MFYISLVFFFHFLVILTRISKTFGKHSDFCNISRKTVQVVQRCPENLKNWKAAAERKNCSAYASQCTYPDRLAYHCVINPYANETLEVCAYVQNILLGYCTEYSISGNMIQRNSKMRCMLFEKNSCPVFYRSTDCFKYPDCYNQTKKSKISADQTTPIYHLNAISSNISFGTYTFYLTTRSTVIVLSAAVSLVLIVISSFWICRNQTCKKSIRNSRIQINRTQEPNTSDESEVDD